MAMGLGQKMISVPVPRRMMEVSWESIHGIPTWETYFEIQIMFVHIGCVKPYYLHYIYHMSRGLGGIIFLWITTRCWWFKKSNMFTSFSVKVVEIPCKNRMFWPSKRWGFFTREKSSLKLKIRPAGVGSFTFATSGYGTWCWCTTLLVRVVRRLHCWNQVNYVQKGTLDFETVHIGELI